MQAQVMTIVWNENAEEPMFLSTGISDPTFYMGEIDFLEKVLDALKKKSKSAEESYSQNVKNFHMYLE